jgi:hypothetical protein
MKLHLPGEKGTAICEADGQVSTTFAYRDVPFSDGSGVAKQILVGVCDRCGEVVAIPPQSTPAIKAAREKAGVSVEAVLPAVYLDALDLACYRIDPGVTQEFRKRLLMYYVHRCVGDEEATRRVDPARGGRGVPRGRAVAGAATAVAEGLAADGAQHRTADGGYPAEPHGSVQGVGGADR